jgi:hypothetical protein
VTVFLFHMGATKPRVEGFARQKAAAFTGALTSLGRYLLHRRNPRSLEYMERLAHQIHPRFVAGQTHVVQEDRCLPPLAWHEVDEIVLLWPDGNGTGWTAIERQVFRQKTPATPVRVLNGRGRFFLLTRPVWRGSRWRRFLEKSLVPELGILVLFLITSPWLALWDIALRRRNP